MTGRIWLLVCLPALAWAVEGCGRGGPAETDGSADAGEDGTVDSGADAEGDGAGDADRPPDGEVDADRDGEEDGSPDADAADADEETIDREPLRTTVPFRVYSFDVDRAGEIVAVGRGTIGGTHLAIYCSGPVFREGWLSEDVPAAAIVRRNRETSEVVVAWAASGAAGLTAWYLRALPASCDPSPPAAPAHAFDAAWVDGSFRSEHVLAMDVTDAGDAWVLSRYGDRDRLTRFEGGLRREQIEVPTCDHFSAGVVLGMALEPGTGGGVLACASNGLPSGGLFVRRFGRAGLVGTTWTAVGGATAAMTPVFDAALTAAGDIALSRVDVLSMPLGYERHVVTLSPTEVERGATLLGTPDAMPGADGFVRDRGTALGFVLVLRPEGTLARFGLDAAAGPTAAGGAIAGSSPVVVDAHGRTFAQDGDDIVRGVVPLP